MRLGRLDHIRTYPTTCGEDRVLFEMAVQYGHSNVVRYVFGKIKLTSYIIIQRFSEAAQSGHLQVLRTLKQLISLTNPSANELFKYGNEALRSAVRNGHIL